MEETRGSLVVAALVAIALATGAAWAATPEPNGVDCGSTARLVVGVFDEPADDGCHGLESSLSWERLQPTPHADVLVCPLARLSSSRATSAG